MKKLLVVMTASFVLVISQGLREAAAGDEGIPLKALAGKYADTAHGYFALCLDSASFPAAVEISCAAATAVVFPQTVVDVGNETDDQHGTSCETYTDTTSDLPPDLSPPSVAVFHTVATTTSYDPATGSGDGSFISYIGGKCVGASFNSSGMTVNATGTLHFVVGNDGKRVDFLATSLTDPIGGVGDFSYSGTNVRQ
jgi:hypothetical protein